MSYPKVKAPYAYNKIINSLPDAPIPPKRPTLPPEPTKPKTEYDESEGCMPNGFGLVMLGIGLFALYFQSQNNVKESFFLPSLGALLFGGFILYFNHQLKSKFYEELPKKNSDYKKEIGLYNASIKSYNEEISKYEDRVEEYNRQLIISKSEGEILKHRNKAFEAFKASIHNPVVHHEIVKKGVSESFFCLWLEKFFSKSIHLKYKLNGDFSVKNYSLYPDFVYYKDDENIYIDIEIDEPYVGFSGDPIHYAEGSDGCRDDFFTNNGWFVVRFTEEQVIRFPEKCCAALKRIVAGIQNLEDVENITLELPKASIWTKDEAHKMAFHRYRNSYLPVELQRLISEEKFTDVYSVPNSSVFGNSNRNIRSYSDNLTDDLPF